MFNEVINSAIGWLNGRDFMEESNRQELAVVMTKPVQVTLGLLGKSDSLAAGIFHHLFLLSCFRKYL